MAAKTPDKLPISVFIIACDEEDRITSTIESVRDWVADVIVVDSGSTDQTVARAQASGAKVIEKDWPGYGPQKRFAEEQCQHKWVLNLDADEVISPELKSEIQEIFRTNPPAHMAYKLKIQDVYPHETSPGKRAYTHRVVRLYNLDQGRYSDSPIHDRVIFQEGTQYTTLSGSVHHRSIRNLSHMIAKTNGYTDLQAEVFSKQGRRISPSRMAFEFVTSFFTAYIKRGHIFRGWYGLILSHHYAYIRFMRIAKMWEKQQQK
jgi:glycosyltransferase involved in cell wall biosynthesis